MSLYLEIMLGIIMAIFIMIRYIFDATWPLSDCSSRLLRNGKDGLFSEKQGELNKNGVPVLQLLFRE